MPERKPREFHRLLRKKEALPIDFSLTPGFCRMQKIDEGSAGVRNCIWAPDGCSILVIADFQIRISVYSLLDNSVKLMRGPKYADKGISFSPDGQLLAYAEVLLDEVFQM